ncbi:MAG: histidine phosphatase family protein [Betaproteobacteria bacterium]|nr:histidine phosphatase family protein [Betaproteobacteria bacterium]
MVLLAAAIFFSCPATAGETLWKALQGGGHVILMRHATTVTGTGDPPGYRLEDCATQRNLSDAGRAEARRIGDMFRDRKVPVGDVRSSLWCRCLDTAKLAFGKAVAWAPLNSFFDTPRLSAPATEAVRQHLATLKPGRENHVFVTHQVNISALTGVHPAMGEMVVLKLDGTREPSIVGRLTAQ